MKSKVLTIGILAISVFAAFPQSSSASTKIISFDKEDIKKANYTQYDIAQHNPYGGHPRNHVDGVKPPRGGKNP